MREMIIAITLLATPMACGNANLQSRPSTSPPSQREGLSARDREVLVALYEATDGAHWKNHDGWLGPSRTECSWYGVTCEPNDEGQGSELIALELSDNNLTGTIPGAIAQLSQLDELSLFGNHLSGMLPDAVIDRWLSGSLWLVADLPQLTDIQEIDFESRASALLCSRERLVLREDRSITSYSLKCRNATPDDRSTYCQVRKGHIWWGEFARLSLLLEKNGFFKLQPEYFRNVTHGTFEQTRVKRAGRIYSVVDYANGGPLNLWASYKTIEGVALYADWEKTTRQAECPKWTDGLPKAKSSARH